MNLLARQLGAPGERARQRQGPAPHAGHGGADDVECGPTPENVAGAFECVEPRVRGARVMIVDDVGTTGATLDACAQAVLKAGAASVMGLTLARTPYGDQPRT